MCMQQAIFNWGQMKKHVLTISVKHWIVQWKKIWPGIQSILVLVLASSLIFQTTKKCSRLGVTEPSHPVQTISLFLLAEVALPLPLAYLLVFDVGSYYWKLYPLTAGWEYLLDCGIIQFNLNSINIKWKQKNHQLFENEYLFKGTYPKNYHRENRINRASRVHVLIYWSGSSVGWNISPYTKRLIPSQYTWLGCRLDPW